MSKMWEKFERALKSRKTTQSVLEERLGLARNRISRWKAKPQTLSLEDAVRLAKAVGLDLSYWVDDSQDEPRQPQRLTPGEEALLGAFDVSGLTYREAAQLLGTRQREASRTRAGE